MKSNSIKALFACLIASVVAVVISCKDDNVVDEPANIPSVTAKEMKFSRINGFYKIDIPGEADWRVTSVPDWLGPINDEGKVGEQLCIFVETNDEDHDLRDTIVVTLADNIIVRLPVHQLCPATDDENYEAGAIDDTALELSYGAGYCVNVIAKNMLDTKYNTINYTPFKLWELKNALENCGEKDAMFDEDLYSSRYESVIGSSTSALANQLGINAGIEVGIKAFKFSVEAGYEGHSSSSDRYQYAILEVLHIVGSRYVRAGMLRYLAQNDTSVLQKTFLKNINKLKKNPNDKVAMRKIIDTYGTHIITHATMGGEMKVSMKMKVDEQCDASKIHAALGATSKALDVSGNVEMSTDERTASNNTTITLQTYGGDPTAFSASPGCKFEQFLKDVKNAETMEKWTKTIKDNTALSLIDIETMPIWDLMPTEELRINLRNYVVGDYQTELYAGTTPDLFVITGYDCAIEAPGRDSIYIPQLDLAIVAQRSIINYLSENEFSTVIYSGPKDNVNYKRGFFVGSKSLKPCKLHILKDRFDNDSIVEKEVFDHLSYPMAIETLYADATGDITIASKTVQDMYMDTKFANWKHDLGMLNKEWTVNSNITVTGKTNYPVTIADGVTLTLDNATINNQIICNGNANIVLKDGTANAVAQGIVNGGEGSTLTINGGGSLTATGKDSYPGIGNGEGYILISGGSVVAKGGAGSAGIGAGRNGHCGNISITKDVKGVAATCGIGEECEPIGLGDGDSSCGYVTIDNEAHVSEYDPNAVDLSYFQSTVNINKNCTLTGRTNFNVVVAQGVIVTLAEVNSSNQLICEGSNEIRLRQRTHNYFHSGVVAGNGNLTISGKGKLSAYGKINSPGIDGLHGDIIIKDGNIYAIGGEGAAGIGAGTTNGCRNIIISGGTVSSVGGRDAAGIGAGYSGDCGSITISGGEVTGTVTPESEKCAGIGSGVYGRVESINISGGTVNGSAHDYSTGIGGLCGDINISGGIVTGRALSRYGTGIGGLCGNINISGGNVQGYSSHYGPGIGYYGTVNVRSGNIVISGGDIFARGGVQAAGIGSGFSYQCGDITIKNTVERVYARKGVYAQDAIGRGKDGTCGTVTIEEGANVIQY